MCACVLVLLMVWILPACVAGMCESFDCARSERKP